MKKIILSIWTFFIHSYHSIRFWKAEKKAKAFMDHTIKESYGDNFIVNFSGTWEEFGKIYGFQFFLVDKEDTSILVEYNLEYSRPFEFDKENFEEQYETMKVSRRASEILEKQISAYYPNAKVLAKRIKNRDSTYRWVNEIYISIPLGNNKETTLSTLDDLCCRFTTDIKEAKVIYNFYFPQKIDVDMNKKNPFSFFEFENFNKKYRHHYRADLEMERDTVEITNRKLHDNLSEKKEQTLKKAIEEWTNKMGLAERKISLLIESRIDRDINQKKFMLTNSTNEKKFGFIALDTYKIRLES